MGTNLEPDDVLLALANVADVSKNAEELDQLRNVVLAALATAARVKVALQGMAAVVEDAVPDVNVGDILLRHLESLFGGLELKR